MEDECQEGRTEKPGRERGADLGEHMYREEKALSGEGWRKRGRGNMNRGENERGMGRETQKEA